jgi:hypothetical protein
VLDLAPLPADTEQPAVTEDDDGRDGHRDAGVEERYWLERALGDVAGESSVDAARGYGPRSPTERPRPPADVPGHPSQRGRRLVSDARRRRPGWTPRYPTWRHGFPATYSAIAIADRQAADGDTGAARARD